MRPYARPVLEGARIAAEFGLGQVRAAEPLDGGHPEVTRLTTDRGTFVIKPAIGAAGTDLYEHAARVLTAAGVRQARPLRTTAGSLVSESGHTAQEFLPGRICIRPGKTQTIATMRHAGKYHAVLADLPVPAGLLAARTVWDQVASAEFLLEALPGLLRSHGPPGDAGHREVSAALRQVERALPQMQALPRQLVHGDIGPDNVLMDGDDVIAIIDFTPFVQPVLFAVATAVYWYHVHGRRQLDAAAIQASFTAAGWRPWTAAERSIWPAMLAREALRRLATPLAIAAEPGGGPRPAYDQRLHAVVSVMNSWPQLQGLRPG